MGRVGISEFKFVDIASAREENFGFYPLLEIILALGGFHNLRGSRGTLNIIGWWDVFGRSNVRESSRVGLQ